MRAVLCRIWSFKGLASFDLLFVHSAVTFCVSRKWQYYYNTIEQRTGRWQRYLEPNLLYRTACLQTFFLLFFYLSRPPRKHMFTSTSSKGHGLWLVDFNPCCLFPCFIHVSSTIVSHLGTSKERRLFNRRKAGDLTQINIIRHSSSWTTNAFHSTVQSTFFILVFFYVTSDVSPIT